jgi:putative flippase GtrA
MKFLVYAAAGGVCTLLNLALIWLGTSVLDLHYLLSALMAFLSVTPVGFWLQKRLTFRTPRAAAKIEWPRYLLVTAGSLATNLALMYLLVSLLGVWYLLAALIAALALLTVNFLVNDRWSFATRR